MSTNSTAIQNSAKARPDTVTDIIGLDVYSKNGVYIGEVEDIRLNFSQECSTGVALKDVNPEIEKVAKNSKNGVVIPYNWLESVHDIIITIDIIQRLDFSE